MNHPASAPRVFPSVEAFADAVGEELGISPWLIVDQGMVDAFADVTRDHQWIHVDPVRAGEGPYGATIAHGYLTLSLLPSMGWQIYTVEGVQMGVNYGLDSVRFPAPVPVGSRIRAVATLTDVQDATTGTRFTVRFVVEIEGADKPACVADTVRVLVG
ncbi:MaoC family dehydratase [Gordonia terrae]|uniref:MaoC family dehydratase n=2 Tax=Gordonia terrae TaxID=2055 RepID=A0AAD0KAS9_9ACTN|nr:MaoC family dehydratase [Gordonia terrae]VTR09188.1 MaoC like domain protein [Clostridioides difficile]ANY21866.1 dehydratase [Gordonia terrae]AWO82601.1 MaoC family dehydratase [Gordonia terrae]VTS22582.1 Probable enoyl-CoA hydratase 1 [Gordonia terrae]GAB46444.1 putative 3-hydroxyacyl-thioester dehydratase [Gordonia terrae NBRC 100016]